MADSISSTNMAMPIPVVGTAPGPDWASDINSCLSIIDSHDHSAGYGVQINPSGLNINSDLSFAGNNLTAAKSVRFQIQSAPLGGASDLGCLYESGVDLYYNDGNGNQVRITQSGGVAGSPGSIASLASPASATYVSANETFVWQSDANTPANMDGGSVLIRNILANSKALTLSAPAAMGSNYTVTLPALPLSQKFMTLDASGNMSAPWAVDNSTIEVSSNTVQVKDLGITAAKIANGTITTTQISAGTIVAANIADGTVTGAKIASATVTASNIVASTITSNEISGTTLTANTYTPVLQAGSVNMTSVIPREAQFIRILNIVQIAARIDFQVSGAGSFSFIISLPFGTSFSSTTQANGVFTTPSANIAGSIQAVSGGSTVLCQASTSSGLAGLVVGNFVFSYRII